MATNSTTWGVNEEITGRSTSIFANRWYASMGLSCTMGIVMVAQTHASIVVLIDQFRSRHSCIIGTGIHIEGLEGSST